jgi:hypothetical protein
MRQAKRFDGSWPLQTTAAARAAGMIFTGIVYNLCSIVYNSQTEKEEPLMAQQRRIGIAATVALIFAAGMVHSAERTVLGEYITADW